MVNIYIGNHGDGMHIQDAIDFYCAGFASMGLSYTISYDSLQRKGVNLLVENFQDSNLCEGLINFKKSHPGAQFWLIATEAIKDGILNTSGKLVKSSTKIEHYEDYHKWKQRTDNLMRILPIVERVICNIERLYTDYSKISTVTKYLPLSFYTPFRKIDPLSESRKDIDFLFTGSLTAYRKDIFDDLRSRGFKVVVLSAKTPEFIRLHFTARSKISLGLKLSDHTEMISKARAHFFLLHKVTHLMQDGTEPSDFDNYLNFFHNIEDLVNYHNNFSDLVRASNLKHENFKKITAERLETSFREVFSTAIN